MKKILLVLLVITFIAGCKGLNEDFVRGVDGYTKVILPPYKNYIKNDTKLDADSKRIRIQTADKFQQLVDEAKKNLER